MTLINWSDDYRLGIDAVDVEHREMIELINDLDASMHLDASHSVVDAWFSVHFRTHDAQLHHRLGA